MRHTQSQGSRTFAESLDTLSEERVSPTSMLVPHSLGPVIQKHAVPSDSLLLLCRRADGSLRTLPSHW